MNVVEYIIENNKPTLYVFGRNNNIRTKEIIKTFEPYFYVKEDEVVYDNLIVREEKGFIGLRGEKIKKVYVKLPGDVPILRKKFSRTWEADVLFSTRYVIDKLEKLEKEKLRVCFLDIETANSTDVISAKEAITCICTYDSITKKYYTFTWRTDLKDEKKSYEDKDIYYFSNEQDMLKMFIKYIQTSDPDIITGWNVGYFDLMYIMNRCIRLKIEYNDLSPLNKVHSTRDEKGVVIKGRIVLDLFTAFERMSYYTLESYKLDKVGELELGLQKIDIGKEFSKVWSEDLELLINYNRRDVEICVKLDKKLNMIEFYDAIRRLAKCSFEEVFSKNRIIDAFILQWCKGKVALPTKERFEAMENFEGAKIFMPKKGVHKNIMVMDLKSLYPSIIISGNFSPETIDKNGDIDIGNGIKFSSKTEGIIPNILKYLIVERDKKKDEMKKEQIGTDVYNTLYLQQYAIKRILNSFYGVMGFQGFRLFSPEIASSVTFVGRKILTFTKETLENNQYDVIYGDTDSVFVKSKKDVIDDIISEGKELNELLNNSYKEFSNSMHMTNNVFEIQFEKIYKAVLFIEAKKRYVGRMCWKGKAVNLLDVVGFEIIRSDASKVSKEIQRTVVDMILEGIDKKEIFKYITNEENKIKKGEYTYEQIGLPKRITKDASAYKTPTLHLRGTEYANKYFKTNIKVGDRPLALYIKVAPYPYPMTDVVCIMENKDLPEGFKIDYDKMIERIITNKLENILDAINWKMENMNQLSLKGFLK